MHASEYMRKRKELVLGILNVNHEANSHTRVHVSVCGLEWGSGDEVGLF